MDPIKEHLFFWRKEDYYVRSGVKDVSFEIRKGEIVV